MTNVQTITCMCFRCMDKRLDTRKTHGGVQFLATNAGASIPVSPPPESDKLSVILASFFLLYRHTKEDDGLLITAQSGHYDCLDVKKIWDAATSGVPITQRYERTLYEPYLDLARDVQRMGLDTTNSLRLLSAAKTLADMNNFLTYPEVEKGVHSNHLKFVVYYEDPTTTPYRLMIYDFAANQYVEPKPATFSFLKMRYTKAGPNLLDVQDNMQLLYHYEVPRRINVTQFVEQEAARLREGTSILLPQNGKRPLSSKVVSALTRENARYAVNYARSAGLRIARNTPLRHFL
ncbi:MAG: hypothetical protein SFW65_05910 [Alphaproteobacteria bacterium]|nr:hypothetical protein [Alphaproteobacteria bacterium]